jgi:zinc/manganese transport system ATP-binding protein
VLSELYRTHIEVVRVRGRLIVVGAEEQSDFCHEEPA